ncbi:MAG: PD40 domain-containing protein [Lentisphaeria bacterium]|nr:PD40 domain-containing protein [Lentisphaeria bacterium]
MILSRSPLLAVFLSAVLLVCGPIAAQALGGQVDVAKAKRGGNPSLCLVAFEGSATAKAHLLRVLKQCDWFTIVPTGAKASYRLSARHTDGASPGLSARLVDGGGKTYEAQRRAAGGGDADEIYYTVVDDLLRAVFKVPGLCSRPIAFAVAGKNSQKEIYTCRFDGTKATRLTHNGTISTEPSWGLNGDALVYTAYSASTTSVVLLDMVRGRQRRLSRFKGLNAGAVLSPDGKWAALCLSRGKRIDLYLLSVETGQVHQVTNDLATESSPCWSPDGRYLCYVSDKAGSPQLYVLPAAGGKSVRLVRDRVEAVSPDWSAVSNRVCFATRRGRQYVIAYVDMADKTRERIVVTQTAGDWESPCWAPDGRHIVCSRRLKQNRSLWMVDTVRHQTLPITGAGDHSLPSWATAK